MAIDVETMRAKLRLDASGFDAGMKKAQGSLTGFKTGIAGTEKLVRGFGSALKGVATTAAGFVVAQAVLRITRAFSSAVGSAVDFGKQMANVNSIAQLSDSALSALGDSVIALSKDPRISDAPNVLAAGLYNIQSSGFAAAEALTILEAGAIAATAGLTTTETSAAAITAVLNAYGLQASDAGAVSNTLFKTVDLGVLSFEQLAGTIGSVLPTAKAAGVSLEELGAAYAVLTRQGVSADEATTQINAVITGLLKPTDALSEALIGLGYANGEALLEAEGFGGALKVLSGLIDGSGTKANELFGDIRQVRGVLGLTTDSAEAYTDMLKEMGLAQDDGGATARALAKQMKSASFQFGQVRKQAVILATVIFKALEPSIAKAAKGIAGFVGVGTSLITFLVTVIQASEEFETALAQVPKPLQGIASLLGTVIGYIISFSNAMRAAYGPTFAVKDLVEFLPGPLQRFERGFLLIANAVGHLVRAFKAHGLSGLLEVLPRELGNVWTALKQFASGLASIALNFIFDTAVSIGGWLWEHKGDIWGGIKGLIGWTADTVSAAVDVVIDGVISLAGDLLAAAGDLWGWIQRKLWGPTTAGGATSGAMETGTAMPPITLGLIIDGLIDLMGDLAELRDNATKWITEAINWTADKTVQVPKLILQSYVEIRDQSGDDTRASRTFIQKVVDAIKGTTSALREAGLWIVKTIWGGIGFAVGALAGLAVGAAAAIVYGLVQAILHPASIATAYMAMSDFLRSVFQKAFDLFLSTVGAMFTAFWSNVGSGFVAVIPIDRFASAGLIAIMGLAGGIDDAVNTVLSKSIANVGKAILLPFAKANTWLKQAGKDVVGGLSGAIDAAVTATLSVSITGVGKAILEPFAAANTWLEQAGTDVVGGLSGAIDTAVEETLGGAISGIISAILTPFAGAIGWLEQAGRDAVQGLINGAANKIPGLRLVVDELIGLFRKIPFLGNSPWPMMIEAGQDAVQGLIVGANSRMRALDATIGQIGSAFVDMSPSLSYAGMGSVSGGGTFGGGPIHVSIGNLTLPNVTNYEEFKEKMNAETVREIHLQTGMA